MRAGEALPRLKLGLSSPILTAEASLAFAFVSSEPDIEDPKDPRWSYRRLLIR